MIARRFLGDARSFLFVPGNRPERFEKALESGADAVVFDLEDSVPANEKSFARASVASALQRYEERLLPLVVRINAVDSDPGREDLRWLSEMEVLCGVMVPKAASAGSLQKVLRSAPRAGLLPLIESAAGYGALSQIASSRGVVRLVVGSIDFMADTGMLCSEGEPELAPLRFGVAMASRMNHLSPPVDGVTTDLTNEEVLREDTRRALRFGFGAKLCIHPRQVAVVHSTLAPSEDEIFWARRVVSADHRSGGAAVQLDGRMIDAPVVLQARRMLARASFAGAT